MDTDEMSRRGVEDAERGEPNPFYYQHYYHYRRSFDRVRRQQQSRVLRRWFGLAVVAVIVGLGAIFFILRTPNKSEAVAEVPAATIAVTVTPKPLFPTPTPPPTAEPTPPANGLQLNSFAIVSNTSGKALRARSEPSLQGEVQATFREGERVHLLEGPVEADGLRWWRVEGEQGSGWSAELSPNGDVLLAPAP